MAVKLPDDPKKLSSLCERYQKQVKALTQKCERENLDWGMEEYYLTQKIRDFEKLCENNKIDFDIVNELDKKRDSSFHKGGASIRRMTNSRPHNFYWSFYG